MSDKITGIGSCDGCGGGGVSLGDWNVTTKLLDGHYGYMRDSTLYLNDVHIGKVEITPRRVECKDCTFWNPERAKTLNTVHPDQVPRTSKVGVCEKEPEQRITGENVACYEGHYDASLWPKRNILMRKF